jgi:23S rRNA-/tRNA-specific pseudouridylate synthase
LVVLERAPRPKLDVLYRDDQLIAVDKPAHIATIPHGEYAHSLLAFVQALPGCEQAAPVHRLDIGTSGVCLFAVHPKFAQQLGQALTAGQKTYVALAQGITHKRGKIRKALLEGRVPRDAETRYERVDVVGTHSLLHVYPIHGRKHQIRRHLASVGHSLLGDSKYSKGTSARFFFDRHGLDRPFLHCARIELALVSTPVNIQAPLATDLQRVVDSLRNVDPSSAWRDE